MKVEAIVPGVYWLQGHMPENVMREPDIAHSFIFEGENEVYLIDTGVGLKFRGALSEFFAHRCYHSATLINTHMHSDHVCNNDLLEEIRAGQKSHIFHPAGLPYLDLHEWMKSEARLAAPEYLCMQSDVFPLNLLTGVERVLQRAAPELLYSTYARVGLRKFTPKNNRTPYLTPLHYGDRVPIQLGGQQFVGWQVGRLTLLEDCAHSPDSVAIYDPVHRILLIGDLLYEYNPLWPSGTFGRSIEMLKAYRALAAEGAVLVLADSHTHKLFRGKVEILPLLDAAIAMYEGRQSRILRAATAEAHPTVESVHHRLVHEDPEFAEMSKMEYPRKALFTRTMIAVALREATAGGDPRSR